ncbi:CD2 antigen cytoplasmic tail-binding protein 2 [Cynara cardunculus var. scolymus]|uniref:CD2 antigen cytoplasmic tail-binding protein 2 n=1 Tax=Cynara cardunculus var. scolymus TaxID=59895 RepID=UPI000D625E87|nr:CD2 antigen cytoplasmic tail-binding protein 2 [Cynara cardunculus var. scolymus]
MEAQPSRKRPHADDDGGGDGDADEFNRKPAAKRVRFPKGKKVKPEDEVVAAIVPPVAEDESKELQDTQVVAKARLKRRHQDKAELINEENGDLLDVVAAAEMQYEDNETLVDDGIQLEPFNLEQERKEGFFDKTGNYVEYVTNDIKDAWLDSIDADPNLAERHSMITDDVVEAADLSSEDIGNIKRRIADVLEPGETVLQALRRLKGSSNSRKEKMSAETKVVFDQLTEDAMKLMEDGDYNVYDEKQEVFQREAEGFEKLAQARGAGTSSSSGNKQPDSSGTADFILNGIQGADNTSNNEDDFDMFAENDDGNATVDPLAGTGPTQNDYVFDESSGYYYSSSLGYYYDPSSALYCNAASGQWYSYNQETGAYDELPAGEANTN